LLTSYAQLSTVPTAWGRITLNHTICTAAAPALTESTGGQGDSVSMDVAALRWLLGAVWSHRSTVGPWQ
jgi:hypothetical protein